MIFKLSNYIFYPVGILKARRMLTESQYWSPEKRRGWIQEHMDKILRHAVENVPYYRKTLKPYESRFNDMIDRLDFSELPMITKDTVNQHYAELCADNCRKFHPMPVYTSGSTGTPTKFLLGSKTRVMHFASIWRMLNWTGYRFGNRFADLTGRNVLKNNRLHKFDPVLNCLLLSSYNFKKEFIPLHVKKLKKFNPFFIKGYPSTIELFCRWMREIGIDDYHPKAVLTCAETLHDYQKKVIQEVLKSTVFDFYGQNECAGLISTCEKGTYHIHEEYSFLELLKDSNISSESDNPRAVVTTTFHNYAMPLIRYQTDDFVSVDESLTCECGRTYKSVKKIMGRVNDFIVTPEGNFIFMPEGNNFEPLKGIRQSQIYQENVDQVVVRIVKTDFFNNEELRTLEESMREVLGNEIKINFKFVDFIRPGSNGKIQFIVSKPAQNEIMKLTRNDGQEKSQ